MNSFLRPAVSAACALLFLRLACRAEPGDGVRLLFSGTNDIRDTWGLLHFTATPMQKIAECPSPGFLPALCRPSTGGTWEVYGQAFLRGGAAEESNTWSIVRAVTRDGITFTDKETVFTGPPGAWSDHF
ncbi:MAG: hypothetical protein FJ221_11420, partial [Lentisphaerae bacterium]|nr:hypothetical protein [Lentisphaerota bacterium]